MSGFCVQSSDSSYPVDGRHGFCCPALPQRGMTVCKTFVAIHVKGSRATLSMDIGFYIGLILRSLTGSMRRGFARSPEGTRLMSYRDACLAIPLSFGQGSGRAVGLRAPHIQNCQHTHRFQGPIRRHLGSEFVSARVQAFLPGM